MATEAAAKKRLTEVPEEKRCTFHQPSGERCKKWRWAGKKFCYQHDPSVVEQRRALPESPGRGQAKILTALEVQEYLALALEQVLAGELSSGQAYAVGYLGQLLLQNLEAVKGEYSATVSYEMGVEEMRQRVRAVDEGDYWEEEEGEEAEDRSEEKEEGNEKG